MRPRNACASVELSTYSSSPPSGMPCARRLTRTPAAVEEADVRALREAGFSDLDILHIAEIVGYYAYVNRIADGLGVPLEDWIADDPG